MQMKFYFIALVSCICLISCGKVSKLSDEYVNTQEITKENVVVDSNNEDYGYGQNWYRSYLVDTYVRLLHIEPHIVRQRHYTSVGFFYYFWLSEPVYAIRITYKLKRIPDSEQIILKHKTGEDGARRFEHYNSEGPTDALAHKFDRIDIISNTNFNGIPAGESLASKFDFYSSSAWPAIQAGRSENVGGGTDFAKQFGFYPFCSMYTPLHKSLDKVIPEDLYLLDAHLAVFVAKEVPEIKEHIFTISYYEGDKVWSVDIPAVFEPYIPEAYL